MLRADFRHSSNGGGIP